MRIIQQIVQPVNQISISILLIPLIIVKIRVRNHFSKIQSIRSASLVKQTVIYVHLVMKGTVLDVIALRKLIFIIIIIE